ncbi:ABC-three component system middle component 7 [Photobacterium damselae]|uniref:ABC-three component system middle component 7 n=1 Tax=Photobacterium damselae TaxID=38293 RepID=UPI0026C955F0
MIVPNKIISIDESVIYKAAKLLPKINNDVQISELYTKNKRLFIDIPDFIDALDVLFALNKIDVDLDNGVIKIA